MNRNRLTTRLAVGALAALAVHTSANAAVIVNTTVDIAPAGGAAHDPYSPASVSASAGDLGQGLVAAASGDAQIEASAGVGVVTDGSIDTVYPEDGPGGDAVDHAAYATLQTNQSLTLDLGGLFNLSRVDIFAGWNDSGRDDVTFNLNVSPNGIDYTTIASYNKGADNTGQITTPITNLHSVVDDGGADIASGVRYVQLFSTDSDNGHAGIAEIDVYGSPVPEPTSLALLALGGLAAMRRRRA